MLMVTQVTKRYHKFVANDEVSFYVPEGEIVVLAGPNGAGKSTIIKSIAGLLRFEGEIKIGEYDNKSLEAKRRLGYIPEVPALYQLLTVWEHMEMVARAYSLNEWMGYAEDLLARFELDDKKTKLASELSKGMQQKLSICIGLLIKPEVLLFDEPFVGLDPHAIKELKQVFLEEKKKGTSILISTHMLDSVSEFWDRVLIMMRGKIEAKRTREEIERRNESLSDLFFEITEGGREERKVLR